MKAKVIMANDLLTGDVIFLSRDSRNWTEFLHEAWVGESKQLVEQMLAIAGDSHLDIDALAVDVEENNGKLALLTYREHLRSQGPSVRPDLGKQALLQAA